MILKSIAKKKNKQLYCVDEFLGEAHTVCVSHQFEHEIIPAYQAFENLETSIAKLFEMGQIAISEKTSFMQGLRVIRSFLESNSLSRIHTFNAFLKLDSALIFKSLQRSALIVLGTL